MHMHMHSSNNNMYMYMCMDNMHVQLQVGPMRNGRPPTSVGTKIMRPDAFSDVARTVVLLEAGPSGSWAHPL